MEKKLRLYLHIPFCVRKCNYCDFVSFAGKEEQLEAYVKALCNEIKMRGEIYKDREISSIYIGGGTPSVLPADLMGQIVETLKKSFRISALKEPRRFPRKPRITAGMHQASKIDSLTEFSIECNPGTVDKKKLKAYKKMGINRISFGLQTTDPEGLKALGRIHSFDDFIESFEAAREAGFDNINVDLMQAIPGQTLIGWQRTLALLTAWKPEHISAYSLIVEEGTPFYEMKQSGLLVTSGETQGSAFSGAEQTLSIETEGKASSEDKLILPSEEEEREIYYYTKEFLENCGYRRYEISNYALPGFECQHNIGYWKRDDYLGLGLNSSSMIDHLRWKNTEDLADYLDVFSEPFFETALFPIRKPLSAMAAENKEIKSGSVETTEAAEEWNHETTAEKVNVPESRIVKEVHPLSHKEQMEEYMFLGLRMTDGISKQKFFDTFGQDFDFTYGETVLDLKSKGLLEIEGDRVSLTDRGIDVSNTVLSEFLF